nr:hypothetical protein [Luteibacter rhizovicinus]
MAGRTQSRGRTQQAHAENGAAVRVDAAGGMKHRYFRTEADFSQRRHVVIPDTRFDEFGEKGCDCRCAAIERRGVHVRMTARVHVADEPGLGPGVNLLTKRSSGLLGDPRGE